MGYRVHYLLKNQMTTEDYEKATHIRVVQNHLHIFADEDICLAVYQSGWWIKAHKIEEE